MILSTSDFNDADAVIDSKFRSEWQQLETTIQQMPLHLKASDQKGLVGEPIFDVVGTNEYLKEKLAVFGWDRLPIPEEFAFLGVDVDFEKNGALVEVQFSNYPFLMNNLLRSELFFKMETALRANHKASIAIIVTKAHMFPASNSTLYYEQAVKQVSALAKLKMFSVPIRVVGLFSPMGQDVAATWTTYSSVRYSRTVAKRETKTCSISFGKYAASRAKLALK